MNPLELRSLGRQGPSVTRLGLGGVPLGDPHGPIDEARAALTLETAYANGVNYYDTAPWYGVGKSEHRMGHVLRTKPRERVVVSTKVGRVLIRPRDVSGPGPYSQRWAGGLPFDLRFDYTRDGVLRSYEDSLQRLGMTRVDALVVHDLDLKFHHNEAGIAARLEELDRGGGFAALADLRERGEIGAIGAGINQIGMIPRFLERFETDFFLVAMPYTLLDQTALDGELPLCVERNVAVVIGAVFSSGILARPTEPGAQYGYKPVEPDVRARVARIDAVCRRHGVPIGAAALQFPLAHPAVSSVIPGADSAEQVRTNMQWMRIAIPPAFWDALRAEKLVRHDAPTP
ncbi:MAG: aldo/keto reductase [Burkholderiales bacterium]